MQAAPPGRDATPRLTDYDHERRQYRVEVPARFNAVRDILGPWKADAPDAVALTSLDGTGGVIAEQTVSELLAAAERFARALLALGLRKGDRVFVMLPRIPEWYTAILGAMRIGAVPMPAPNQLTTKDIAFRIDQGQAVAAITDIDGARKLDAGPADALETLRHRIACVAEDDLPPGWSSLAQVVAGDGMPELDPDPTAAEDPLLLYFTSGTVSNPKMVLHDQSYALGHVGTARFWHDLRPGDLHWTVTDTGWAKAAWGGLFGQWHERATVVQVLLGRPDAETIFDILAQRRITSFCAPPTLYRLLVQGDFSAHDLSALRHCTSAGEPLNPEVIRAWRDGTGGLTVYDGYGQTETTALVANYRAVEVRPGSMGKPVPGYEVDVIDAGGRRAGDGEVGAIAVRTQPRPVGLFVGYDGDPAATAERFVDGWYLTGDRGVRDADGYLWFEGRDDDVITSSAYRIGPFEVESALIEHPAVAEAAVVGKDDPKRTQIVTAFVILAPGHSPSDELKVDLQDHAKRTTAPYKYPREVHFVDELPKTVSGKIRRSELRDQLRAGRFD